MTFSNVKDNKTIDDFLVENQMKTHYEYDYENPPCQSEDVEPGYL